MKKFYLLGIMFYFTLLGARAVDSRSVIMLRNEAVDTVRRLQQRPTSKITDNRPDRPRNELKVNIIPFRPVNSRTSGSSSGYSSSSSSTAAVQRNAISDFKVLNNVKVTPNPVEDQINISYYLNKDSNVTIKIMDVLGNEIATLLSQRLPAGEQNHSFAITSRLNSGYYFIRLIAGNETVVKRISVL